MSFLAAASSCFAYSSAVTTGGAGGGSFGDGLMSGGAGGTGGPSVVPGGPGVAPALFGVFGRALLTAEGPPPGCGEDPVDAPVVLLAAVASVGGLGGSGGMVEGAAAIGPDRGIAIWLNIAPQVRAPIIWVLPPLTQSPVYEFRV